MKALSVLLGCECSGVVREAFRALGHDAWSCDIKPADDGSAFHIVGDVREAIMSRPWDIGIFFPPCTYLTRAGARWWPDRQQEQAEALDLVRFLLDCPIPLKALENPPGKIGTAIRVADQYVQPWQFGHPETKMTGLWLDGLPRLESTDDVFEVMQSLPKKERNRIHYMRPGPERAAERSRFYPGIAKAMAEQWSAYALDVIEPRRAALGVL